MHWIITTVAVMLIQDSKCQSLIHTTGKPDAFLSPVRGNLRSERILFFIPTHNITCKQPCFMIQLASWHCNIDLVCKEFLCETELFYHCFYMLLTSLNSWSPAITHIIKYLTQTSPNDEYCRILINSRVKTTCMECDLLPAGRLSFF